MMLEETVARPGRRQGGARVLAAATSSSLPSTRRLLIIYNPAAGRRRKRRFDDVVARLQALGCLITISQTSGPGDARRLAGEADTRHFDVLVVAGGDGTVNEAINGLGDADLPLALMPLGTSNVLAAEIGLRGDPARVAETIASGVPRPISVGVANGHRFVLMAGVGFDAHVVATVDLRLKRWVGRSAYGLAIIRQLWRFSFPHYTVRVDGAEWPVLSVIVASARRYGGPFVCAPDAGLDDPVFRVCLFERSSRLALAGYVVALFAGFLPRMPGFRILPAGRVEITGPAADPVQADGDVIARLGVTIERLPNALSLIFPGPAVPAPPSDTPAGECAVGRPLAPTVRVGRD
jgi:YegS/Rv2252/BmrU family lipid kinase